MHMSCTHALLSKAGCAKQTASKVVALLKGKSNGGVGQGEWILVIRCQLDL